MNTAAFLLAITVLFTGGQTLSTSLGPYTETACTQKAQEEITRMLAMQPANLVSIQARCERQPKDPDDLLKPIPRQPG